MAVVVVGGSRKDVGKTGLVCATISALREFGWTAVKITGHDYGPAEQKSRADALTREEESAGQDTDTARYLAAGARRALLMTRTGSDVPIEKIRQVIGSHRNVIFESNRVVDAVKPDVCLALIGGHERKPSFERLMRAADAVLIVRGSGRETPREGVRRFELESVDRLPAEFVTWLRERLAGAVTPMSAGQ